MEAADKFNKYLWYQFLCDAGNIIKIVQPWGIAGVMYSAKTRPIDFY